MTEPLSYLSVAGSIKSLRLFGVYSLEKNSSKLRYTLQTVYITGVVCFFSLYTVQQILKIGEVQDDIDKVMGTMFLLLTNTDCIYKICNVFWKSEKCEKIMDVLKGPIFNQGKPEHRSILMQTVRNAQFLFRTFNAMSLFTCFLWVLHPTVLHMKGKTIEFPVWLPFDANKNPQYYLAVVYVWVQTSWLAVSNATLDMVVTYLLEQCRTQISILRFDLENVVENSKKEALKTSSSYSEVLDKRFNEMLIHHQEIVNTADKIQDVFSWTVFYLFLVSGWILCTSAYRLVNANPASIEFVSMIMYVVCIVIELALYCYYGNEISYESEKLMESAYFIDWLEMPMYQRRSLLIFMERIKKPILPMAGSFIPLSNSTFISIIRSSFSFYAFLKNSEH